jgi:hypothetical protein
MILEKCNKILTQNAKIKKCQEETDKNKDNMFHFFKLLWGH